MNYKETGREYTLQDLWDLGLKLECGDVITGEAKPVFKVGYDISVNDANTQVSDDKLVLIDDCKQLDEYLAKQESDVVEFKCGESVCLNWKNKSMRKTDIEYLLVGFDLDNNAVLQHKASKNIFTEPVNLLRKPLTEQQKKERLAYKLYCEWAVSYKSIPFPFDKMNEYVEFEFWLNLVDKTGYKGE